MAGGVAIGNPWPGMRYSGPMAPPLSQLDASTLVAGVLARMSADSVSRAEFPLIYLALGLNERGADCTIVQVSGTIALMLENGQPCSGLGGTYLQYRGLLYDVHGTPNTPQQIDAEFARDLREILAHMDKPGARSGMEVSHEHHAPDALAGQHNSFSPMLMALTDRAIDEQIASMQFQMVDQDAHPACGTREGTPTRL